MLSYVGNNKVAVANARSFPVCECRMEVHAYSRVRRHNNLHLLPSGS